MTLPPTMTHYYNNILTQVKQCVVELDFFLHEYRKDKNRIVRRLWKTGK